MTPFAVLAEKNINNQDTIYLTTFFDIFDSNIKTRYKCWFNDLEVTKYNSHGLFPYNPLFDDIKEFMKDKSRITWSIISCIGDPNGAIKEYWHIGNVSLQSINMINRSAELACIIGEKEYWNKGIMTWACEEIIRHGFMKIGLNRIWSGTSILNVGMQKIFEKLGFQKEGIFREAQYLNENFEDVYAYGVLKSDPDSSGNSIKEDTQNIIRNEYKKIFDIFPKECQVTGKSISIESVSIPSQEEEIESETLIKRMEEIRSKNNSHWMDIVRLAFKNDPEKAKEIMREINSCDKQISNINQQLSE